MVHQRTAADYPTTRKKMSIAPKSNHCQRLSLNNGDWSAMVFSILSKIGSSSSVIGKKQRKFKAKGFFL